MNMKFNNKYIIITPCKNEEENLQNLIQSIIKQSITPELWTIIDDGSNDRTPEIIKEIKSEYEWIKSISLKGSQRDLTIHVSNVIKTGLDFAQNFCKENNINYDFIMFLDSDMYMQDNDFLKKLLTGFEEDDKLGIASGNIQYMDVFSKLHDANSRSDTISGGEMMCRRECIEEIGGVPISHSWESVMRVKTILNGWKIKRFKEIKIIHTRETGSAEGLKNGYYLKGASEYYLDLNPFIVGAKGLKYCLKRPYYLGFAYLIGYFSSWIKRKDKTKDPEISEYYYYKKPREIWQHHFKNMFRRL